MIEGYGIYLTSIPLFEPCAPRLLKAFLIVLSNSIGLRCVNQTVLDILERSCVCSLSLCINALYGKGG